MPKDHIVSRDLSHTASGARGGGAEHTPAAGDWIVTQGFYGPVEIAGPVSRLTPLRAYHPSRYRRGREEYTDLRQVQFAGSKGACEWLVERIRSSRAQMAQERLACEQRHADRVARLFEQASALPPQPQSDEGK